MMQIIRENSVMKWIALFCALVLLSGCLPWNIEAQENNGTAKLAILVKTEEGQPIKNAVFEIQNEQKEVMETCTSDENGRAEIKEVDDGNYQLVQIKTQEEYEPAVEQPIEIKTEVPIREEIIINKSGLKEPEDDPSGADKKVGSEQHEEDMPAVEKQIPETTGDSVKEDNTISISVGEVYNNSYKVSITGVGNSEGISGVLFPTWSQTNGQDDIRWEKGTYAGNDTWEATINLKDYKQTFDTFISHAYIIDKSGKMTFSGFTEKIIENPVGDVAVNITQNPDSTTQFTVSTLGCAGKNGIGSVWFPTWTERNGQDDIVWYQGILGSNGEYSVTIDSKDHGFETGLYNVHTYIYGLQGDVTKTSVNTYKMADPTPNISVGEVNNDSYKVRVTGVSSSEGVNGVMFPTWSQTNGQDDIRWESGIYVGNDTWEATINLKNYRSSYDTFITHAYVVKENQQLKYVCHTEKIINNPFQAEPLELEIQPDRDVSKFVISTKNCSGKSGIGSVLFPVWTTRNGQDDIQWIQGILGSNGEYSAVVDIENHGFETGPYLIHAYLHGNGDENIAFSNNSFTLEKTTPTFEYDNAVLNNVFKMRIKNVSNENGVSGVMLPTWSNIDGQDDIHWEQTTYIGNHTWETTVDLKKYNQIVDTFITHAYLVDKNGKFVMSAQSSRTIKQNTATVYGYFAYPLDTQYQPNPDDPTDWFGARWGDIHEGIDIPADRYANCYSVCNGMVERAGYFMGYGRYVRIRTTDCYGESVSFFYGHLQEINVSVGQNVGIGTKIGSVGGSGYDANANYIDNAYGSHLHFGAIANADDACVDPELWIDFHNPYNNIN